MKQCSWLPVLCLVAAACSSEAARDEGSCAADSDCKAPTAACDLGASNTCVQCVPGRKTEACVGTSPVCDASFRCQPCTRHADCLSDACMPDGSCAAESNVLYLREGGMGTACSKAMPCGSFAAALAALSNTQTILRVSGLISNSEGFIAFGSAVLLGDSAGAALRGGGTGAAAPILSLVNGARVEIYDVAFRDSRDAAVSISASSQATLVRSRIDNAAGEGLVVAGKARLRQSEVTSCNDPGRPAISALAGGELAVDRSRISDNDGAGVVVADGGKFVITNSFLTGNKVGGALTATSPTNDSRLELSTIVDNVSGAATNQAGGVVCDNPSVSVRHNILYRNTGGPAGTVQRLGRCAFTGNLELAAGPGDTTLQFRSEATSPKDYHLTAQSPASVRDVAGVTCTGLQDFDGDERPQGGSCDLGADEVK